jgi:hypothetical protein
MFEFTPQQMQVLERLVAAGLRPIAIPPYESALCMYRGRCAVVLAPVESGGLKVLAATSVLVDGHFAVRLKRPSGDAFVWKRTEVAATPELLEELNNFRRELNEILELPALI